MQMMHRDYMRVLAGFFLFLRNLIYRQVPHLGEGVVGSYYHASIFHKLCMNLGYVIACLEEQSTVFFSSVFTASLLKII